MKRAFPVILLVTVLLGSLILAPVRAAGTPVTVHVLSYNAENVFDDRVDGTEYEEYGPSSNYYSDRMWQVKLDHLHNVLKEAGSPQIVGLVEIENARMGQMILDRVKDLGYTSMAMTTGQSNMQCMLLSTFPIQFIASLPTTWQVRDILVASVDVDGDPLYVLVNHWKAKDSSSTSEQLRIQDAKVARTEVESLLRRDASADILLMGDFNSSEDEHELTGQPTGINDELKDTGNKADVTTALGTATSLYDGWYDVPQAQRGSEVYHSQWDDLDHLIMSPGLFDSTGLSYDTGTFQAFRAPFLLASQRAADGRQIPNRWQVTGTHHSASGYSDHLPVTAAFTVWPSSHPVTPSTPSTPVSPSTPSTPTVTPVVTTVTLRIGSATMQVMRDGKSTASSLDAPPVLLANRTMVPARAILEAFGGTAGWNAGARTATLVLGTHALQLTIGSGTAYLDGRAAAIDTDPAVVPVIQSGRTLLPLRFVGESFGMTVGWDAATSTITLSLAQP